MELFPDLSFQRLLYQACAAAFIVGTHGFWLALAARLFADRGPQYDGRLSLNPLRHLEPVGAFALVFTQFGWVRPVALDPTRLRGRNGGPLFVALIALAGTAALGWVAWLLRPVAFAVLTGRAPGVTAVGLLETLAETSLYFTLVNLIPILPLTMGHALVGVAPRLAAVLRRRQLFIAIALGVFLVVAGPALRALAQPLLAAVLV